MKKNVAGQSIGAQMIAAADGSDFTGAVTVYVTKDNGTQTVGGVGAGACTHEGNGYHSYAPAQAETNADHVAWTFKGTGAITATIQVYPSAADELFSRLATMLEAAPGSPGEFRFTADALARIQTVIGMQAGNLDTQLAALAALIATRASQLSVDDLPTNAELATALAAADDAVLAQLLLIKVVTDKLHSTLESGAGSPSEFRFSADALIQAPTDGGLDAAEIRAALGLANPDLDAQFAALPTAVENADALLDRDMSVGADSGSPTVRTVRQALRILRNRWTIIGTTQSIKKEDDSTESWQQELGSTPGSDPVTSTDPAGP